MWKKRKKVEKLKRKRGDEERMQIGGGVGWGWRGAGRKVRYLTTMPRITAGHERETQATSF